MNNREAWSHLSGGDGGDPEQQPQRIAALCVELLGVSGAGISMVTTTGNRGVVCATDAVASRIEDLQLTLGEGPCVDAVFSGAPVLIPSLNQPRDVAISRWPGFMAGAAAAGVVAVFAFPLRIGAIAVGALDLYRNAAGDLSDPQLAGALLAADAAAIALLHVQTGAEAYFDEGSEAGSTYQLQVHQATGMVQVQLGITTEEAFLMLRARAFADDRPVADVARDVVDKRLRFSVEDS